MNPVEKVITFYFKLRIYGARKVWSYMLTTLYSALWLVPIKKSYSQNGEDLAIDKLLNYKKHGFYVDVGAHDSSLRNNTKRFYQRGWRGINIEPDYNNYSKLAEARPRDINLNIGIGDKNEIINFYRFFPDTISTFSKENLKGYQKYGFKLKETIKIKTRKLSDILAKYAKGKKIDFISIDAEGYDLKVLKSNDWRKFRPALICVEARYHFNNEHIYEETKEIHRFLTIIGYQSVWMNSVNEVYKDKAISNL